MGDSQRSFPSLFDVKPMSVKESFKLEAVEVVEAVELPRRRDPFAEPGDEVVVPGRMPGLPNPPPVTREPSVLPSREPGINTVPEEDIPPWLDTPAEEPPAINTPELPDKVTPPLPPPDEQFPEKPFPDKAHPSDPPNQSPTKGPAKTLGDLLFSDGLMAPPEHEQAVVVDPAAVPAVTDEDLADDAVQLNAVSMPAAAQHEMTVELLKAALPRNLQGYASQDFADQVNQVVKDPIVCEQIRDNFLSYSKVLGDGKFKTEDYLNAVVYVTHKLMGYNNQDSYIRAFPDRYQILAARGVSAKDLSAYVSAYAKNKLVNLILEQSLIPSWLLNRDTYQKAINCQLDLMTNANSEKVRAEAANSILTHLKQPEVKKIELDIGVRETSGMDDLRATMADLARQQLKLIDMGQSARSIARAPLVIEHEKEPS